MTSAIESNTTYVNQTFDAITINQQINSSTFDNCIFLGCSFANITISRCEFISCEFKQCDLSNINLTLSEFSETHFHSCKMIGINWHQAKWPYIALNAPILFNNCDLSLSSFFELKLSELILINCKAHDVDFRGCELTNADLSNTDFDKSQFMRTNLKNADFHHAINYVIDPRENTVNKARFSLPGACGLLMPFNIIISDLE